MGVKLEEELIKRYLYLYENKEIILSLCINYGVEENYYKEQIKKKKALKKRFNKYIKKARKNNESTRIYENEYALLSTEEEEESLKQFKPYLFKEVKDEIVNSFEEFLFTDDTIENTQLYKRIEDLKDNPKYLDLVQGLISELEERREKNEFLKRIPAFTVWKILTYVKNKNKGNKVLLDALERYYNIDRYMLTGINWESGYKLLPVDYEQEDKLESVHTSDIVGKANFGGEYGAIICSYPGNEFEEEDNYFAFDWCDEFKNDTIKTSPRTFFMCSLASMPMLSEELKKEIYEKIKSSKQKIK